MKIDARTATQNHRKNRGGTGGVWGSLGIHSRGGDIAAGSSLQLGCELDHRMRNELIRPTSYELLLCIVTASQPFLEVRRQATLSLLSPLFPPS